MIVEAHGECLPLLNLVISTFYIGITWGVLKVPMAMFYAPDRLL